MKTEKFASTMSAALLAVAGGDIVSKEAFNAYMTETAPAPLRMHGDTPVSNTENLLPAAAAAAASYTGSIRFTAQLQTGHGWLESDEREFSKLAMKDAIDHLSEIETNRLSQLQDKRRVTKGAVTSEMILQRYRREKLDRELLELFSRYVSVSENAAYPT